MEDESVINSKQVVMVYEQLILEKCFSSKPEIMRNGWDSILAEDTETKNDHRQGAPKGFPEQLYASLESQLPSSWW